MADTAAPEKEYFNSIDGLRLCASVNIVLFHMVAMGGLNDLGGKPGWFFVILKGPMFHASLFFILAGFIFTVKYARYAERFSGKTLFMGRLRDLYPLHAITVAAMIPFAVFPYLTQNAVPVGKILYSAFIHLGLLFSFLPFGVFKFNTPSWALSAFFLCYLLFGPTLKLVLRVKSRRSVVAAMALTFVPVGLWAYLFVAVDNYDLYTFFHIFAPARFFEFVLGILLARLYYYNNTKPRTLKVRDIPLLNDAIIVITLVLLFINLAVRPRGGVALHWVTYHIFVLPLYAVLLYRLARGDGLIARLFATKVVRTLGKSSFYPYLLHVPLIAWTCTVLEKSFGYYTFLHRPLNIAVFLILLYGGSYLWYLRSGRRKRKTYRLETKERVSPQRGPN